MYNQTSRETTQRILSIDAMRGLVMLIMLLDHVRETIYLHMQVGDPVDVTVTSPSLFFMRFLSSFCAPTFVLLAGLSAYLYKCKHTRKETAYFLFSRGIFLVVLEVLVIGFAWTGVFPPEKIYLQIIWCIGICMICLAGLIFLPRILQIVISIALIAGHNLLDNLVLSKEHWFHVPWAILHQRDWIDFFGIPARTSYPVLPWVGVIVGGYVIGNWFSKDIVMKARFAKLMVFSLSLLVAFFFVRGLNIYGDMPWVNRDDPLLSIIGFVSLTKYPASFLFLLYTLSFTGFGLMFFEKYQSRTFVKELARFGSGAMFFYVFHLYILKGVYLLLVAIYGTNEGDYFGVSGTLWVWAWTLGLSVPLVYMTLKFAGFKQNNRHLKWLSYI